MSEESIRKQTLELEKSLDSTENNKSERSDVQKNWIIKKKVTKVAKILIKIIKFL